MIAALLKSSGADQLAFHSATLILIGMLTVSFCFGWLADWVTRVVSFGVLGNALIMFTSMLAGLVIYNAKIMPLKHTLPPMLVIVAIGSGVIGLTALTLIASRPLRA